MVMVYQAKNNMTIWLFIYLYKIVVFLILAAVSGFIPGCTYSMVGKISIEETVIRVLKGYDHDSFVVLMLFLPSSG